MTDLAMHHCCSGCDASGHCTHGYEGIEAQPEEDRLSIAAIRRELLRRRDETRSAEARIAYADALDVLEDWMEVSE